MSSTPHEASSREVQVSEAIATYLEAVDRGEAPDLARFLEQHADIAQELESFFANQSQFAEVVGNLSSNPTPKGRNGGSTARKPASNPDEPTRTFQESGVPLPVAVIRYFRDYELLQEIARGGMGVVFKARQVKLNRIVAVKMILAGSFAGPEDVQRFHTEAEAVAKLDHPGIVPIYEVGEHEGQHFFSMGFVEGQSLSTRVANGPLPAREAAEVVRAVSEAVQYAHDQGVVHRDLKPGNILLDKGGKPRVTDFGLAKLTECGSDLTGTGQILGTPSYMPPEQAGAKGVVVGRASDVYSLGAILYCLLTGRPPFQAASPLETLSQVQNQEPVSPKQLNPVLPIDLDTIVLKCLDKTPARRYASARELAEELERYMDGRPILARPIGRLERILRWCRRNLQVAILIAAVVASLLVGTVASSLLAARARLRANEATQSAQAAEAAETRERNEAQKAKASAEAAEAAETRARNEATNALELLAKNQKLAGENAAYLYRLRVDNGLQLSNQGDLYGALLWFSEPMLRDPDNVSYRAAARMRVGNYLRYIPRFRDVQLLRHAGAVNHFAVDPQGRRIVTACSDHTARIWDAASGQPLGNLMTHLGNVVSATFSPEGERIVTASEDGTARLWNATTGAALGAPLLHESSDARQPVKADGKPTAVPVRSAQFNSDGTYILSVDAEGAVHRWDAASGRQLDPPFRHHPVNSAAVESYGNRIVTAGRDGTARVWDVASGEQAGPQLDHRVGTTRNAEALNAGIRDPEFSRDGRYLLTIAVDNAVHVWESASGRKIGRALLHRHRVNAAAFSPDSKLIVTAVANGTVKVWETATGQTVGPPLVHDHDVTSAVFSPDGRWIASASGSTVQVWESATGQALAPALTHHADVTCVRFSPDGFRVITASADRTVRIWELFEEQPVGPLPTSDIVEFPTFYYFKDSDGSRSLKFNTLRSSVSIVDSASNSVVEGPVHESEITSASFSPDGLWVATTSSDDKVRIWESATGNALGLPLANVKAFAFGPDGRQFVTTNFRNQAQVWETATGQPVGAALLHDGAVNSALFSPDGLFIVTASSDNRARVWESATGRAVGPPLSHRASVSYAGFEPGGRAIITYADDQRWRWDVTPDNHPDDAFAEMTQLFAARKLDAGGAIQSVPSEELEGLQQTFRRRFPEEFRAASLDFVRNWRSRQIEDAESKNQWSTAAFHLNQLMASEPQAASLAIRRAIARLNAIQDSPKSEDQMATILEFPANRDELVKVDPLWWCCDSRILMLINQGKIEKVVEFLGSALELGIDDLEWWKSPAAAALVAENIEQHREVCRQVLERFAQIADAPTAVTILEIILPQGELDPSSQATLSRLGALVESELIDEPRIVGAVRFREKKYRAALEQFQIRARNKEPTENDEGHRPGAWEELFLAMICHSLGQTDEARDHFRQALEWIDANPGIPWARQAEISELRRQAASLLGITGM